MCCLQPVACFIQVKIKFHTSNTKIPTWMSSNYSIADFAPLSPNNLMQNLLISSINFTFHVRSQPVAFFFSSKEDSSHSNIDVQLLLVHHRLCPVCFSIYKIKILHQSSTLYLKNRLIIENCRIYKYNVVHLLTL